MKLESYSNLWKKPFYYVLGPLPERKKALAENGVQYYPYRWLGIRYYEVNPPDDVAAQIIQNMLEAGVPIIDPLPEETQEEALAHFWTDRLHEFALITTTPGSSITHNIYHFDPPERLLIPIPGSVYRETVNRMLAAGAKVLHKEPEPPK